MIIEARDVGVSYRGRRALSGVTTSISAGEITALVGPSGCGKTSFLSCLNRLSDLITGCEVTGDIRVGNDDIRNHSCNVIALRRRVGMIFQKPNPFPLSIRRNLALPLAEYGVRSRDEVDTKIETALRDVGLFEDVADRLNEPALGLSGGQQQRLCIARALVLTPDVLLMDEPCSALDPISSGVVEDLIWSLPPRYTVLIVTHNLAQARRIADRVLVFWVQDGVGQLIEQGPTDQIFEAPQHELTAAYVGGIRG